MKISALITATATFLMLIPSTFSANAADVVYTIDSATVEETIETTGVATTAITTTYKPTTTVVTDKQITEAQQATLDDLTRKGIRLTGEFQRAKAVVLGEISADSARFTLDEINEVLEQCSSFNEIYEKLKFAHVYPDFIGGSGIGRIEYWLDELGNKKIILFIEPE